MKSNEIPLHTKFVLWRLYQGGMEDVTELARVTGLKVHGQKIRSALMECDRLLAGQRELFRPVRCNGCGGKTQIIPCVICRTERRGFRPV